MANTEQSDYIRYFLAISSDSRQSSTVVALKSRFSSCHSAESRCGLSQDPRGEAVIGEETYGSQRSECRRELRGEDDHVQSWFADVSAVDQLSRMSRFLVRRVL